MLTKKVKLDFNRKTPGPENDKVLLKLSALLQLKTMVVELLTLESDKMNTKIWIWNLRMKELNISGVSTRTDSEEKIDIDIGCLNE